MKCHRVAWAVIAAIGLIGSACGAGTKATKATLKDFSIALATTGIKAGDVTFSIKNTGPSVHEFVVIKTDDQSGSLPTTVENGVKIVDEEAQGLEGVDEVEDIANGDTEALEVHLDPAHYVVICNIPGHYIAGMHTDFTVTS